MSPFGTWQREESYHRLSKRGTLTYDNRFIGVSGTKLGIHQFYRSDALTEPQKKAFSAIDKSTDQMFSTRDSFRRPRASLPGDVIDFWAASPHLHQPGCRRRQGHHPLPPHNTRIPIGASAPWPGYGEVLRIELLIAGTIAQQCPISAHTRLSLLPQRISVYAALGTAPRLLATSSKVRPVSA